MEYIIALVVGLLGFGYYQFDKRKKAEVEAKLAAAKAKDAELKKRQDVVDNEIQKIDNKIVDLKRKQAQKVASRKNLTLKERAALWKKK